MIQVQVPHEAQRDAAFDAAYAEFIACLDGRVPSCRLVLCDEVREVSRDRLLTELTQALGDDLDEILAGVAVGRIARGRERIARILTRWAHQVEACTPLFA